MRERFRNAVTAFLGNGLSPSQIAFGVSLGNFVGILPFLGLHTILALALAWLLRLNMAVVFLGTQISNPLSFPFILFVSAQIGSLVLKGALLPISFTTDMGVLKEYALLTLLGSVILGLSVGALSYPFTLAVAKRFRR